MEAVKKPSKKLIVWSIIIFLVALLLRVHYINIKQGFHCDELYSINIANENDIGYKDLDLLPETETLTGKELKKLVLFNDSSVKEVAKDVIALHKNTNDNPHTNLYYTALRIWTLGHTSNDANDIKWRCCSLNLVFFSLSFLIMFKMLRKIFKEDILILLGLIAAFFNTAGLSMAIFIRPYELQTTIFLLLTYVVINLYHDIEENKLISTKNFVKSTGSLVLTLLSGYFSILYIALLALILITKSILKKQYKNIIFLFASALTAVLLTWLCYFSYFNGFTSGRAKDTSSIPTQENNFYNTIMGWAPSYLCFLYYIPCCLLFVVAFIRNIYLYIRKKKNNETFNLYTPILPILGVGIFWSFIILFLAPFKIIRYIAPVFPFLAILYPLIIANLSNIEKKVFTTIFSTILFVFSLTPQITESFETHYPALRPIIPDGSRIENLFLSQKIVYPYAQTPNIPVHIVADGNLVLQELALSIADEQKVSIQSVEKYIEIPKGHKEIYLVIEFDDPILLFLPRITKEYDVKLLTDVERYIVTGKLTKK